MEPMVAHISYFSVSGLTVRTTNRDEFNQETARIPGLWAQFFSSGLADSVPNRLPGTPIFGVYSAYESDATGFYDLTAGVSVAAPNPDYGSIEIREGKYLVFEARGPMPAAVIQTWTAIWTYFEQHPHVQRSFLTDFESWSDPEHVQIHIGVAS
ncbi:GyrI-like domain-containing protein [Burkholderia sp. S-53]|uniref:GyrI-like domain-containing protein n=1 Tax=Burkholderia sp. S-53 TaxID=2906514 RepID=UPI0021D0C795|nr:GyrI-like domain-containing protein [Burkholderia sp. S-53]UXU85276.1 GyrI-like domain-containing protein [Burkholderia sp. S-53]